MKGKPRVGGILRGNNVRKEYPTSWSEMSKGENSKIDEILKTNQNDIDVGKLLDSYELIISEGSVPMRSGEDSSIDGFKSNGRF